MIGWIKHLRQKWNDWCGDREMEIAIRQQLTKNGFFGATATLRNVRLVAVQRPGWLQIFRFEVTARVRPADQSDESTQSDESPDGDPEYRQLFGLVRDDIRYNINTVRVFEDEEGRSELFGRWSEDLICLRGAQGLR